MENTVKSLYISNGYLELNNPAPGTRMVYKDHETHISVVVIVDNKDKYIEYKENVENFLNICDENVRIKVFRDAYYFVIACDGTVPTKSLIKGKNICCLTSTGKLYCSNSISDEIKEEYDILCQYIHMEDVRYAKNTAYIETIPERHTITSVVIAVATVLMFIYNRNISVQGISVETVFLNKEYTRLMTYIFAHAGLIHLAYNIIAMISFGRELERRIGWFKYLIVYMYGGIGAGIISCVMKNYAADITSITVGASGSIYSVAGALLVYNIYYAIKFKDTILPTLLSVGILVGSGFMINNVDIYAHIGGFALGMCAAVMFLMYDRIKRHLQYVKACDEIGC